MTVCRARGGLEARSSSVLRESRIADDALGCSNRVLSFRASRHRLPGIVFRIVEIHDALGGGCVKAHIESCSRGEFVGPCFGGGLSLIVACVCIECRLGLGGAANLRLEGLFASEVSIFPGGSCSGNLCLIPAKGAAKLRLGRQPAESQPEGQGEEQRKT